MWWRFFSRHSIRTRVTSITPPTRIDTIRCSVKFIIMFLWFVIKLYKRNVYFSLNLTKCQKWITQRNDLIWCGVHSSGTLSGEIKYVLWINRIISHHWQNVHWVFSRLASRWVDWSHLTHTLRLRTQIHYLSSHFPPSATIRAICVSIEK